MNVKGKVMREVTMRVRSFVSEIRTVHESQEIGCAILWRQYFDLLQDIYGNFVIRSFYHGFSYPSSSLSFVS